jgi:hypothetical protein
LLNKLFAAPNNILTDSAWQTYFMLSAPTNDEQLIALRTNYLGQVGELLAASRWANNPSTISGCNFDLHDDGISECIVSNLKYFAILSPAGARMSNLVYLDTHGPHQLVAPTSQFTIGLSDPSEWNPDLGQAADPSVIPGAFVDEARPWISYSSEVTPEGIVFTSPDGTRIKTYHLLENGVEITYQVEGVITTHIPLALDPYTFYFDPSTYIGSLAPGTWTFGLSTGTQIEVVSNATLSIRSFTDSFPYLALPENPDLSYPAGHYLPFPVSVVDIQGNGGINVVISVK